MGIFISFSRKVYPKIRVPMTSNFGFTLIEIIVAITILSIVLISVFQIYSQIITTSKRLELARGLQGNTRTITETIASEVRSGGIAFECYRTTPPPLIGCGMSNTTDYTGVGSDILILRGDKTECNGIYPCFVKYYLVKPNLLTDPSACTDTDKRDQNTPCYLQRSVIANGNQVGPLVRLSDPTTRVRDLRFFISGVGAREFSTSTDTEGKVTMAFTISLAPRQGLDSKLAESLVIPVQTTITEKLYKNR